MEVVDELDLKGEDLVLRQKLLRLIEPFKLSEDAEDSILTGVTKPEQLPEVFIRVWTLGRVKVIMDVILNKTTPAQKKMANEMIFLAKDLPMPQTNQLPRTIEKWIELISYGQNGEVSPFVFAHRALSPLVSDVTSQHTSEIWHQSFSTIFPILIWAGLDKKLNQGLLGLLKRNKQKET